MAAKYKINEGDFEIHVFQKSFKVVKHGPDGGTTPFIFTQKQIEKEEARRYLKGLTKFWQDRPNPRPMTHDEMVKHISNGRDIHEPKLREIVYCGYDKNINAADGETCETLVNQLDEYPVWEPEDVGEKARRERASHLYAMLNEAYKQGRAAAKVAVADRLNDIVYKA